MGVASYTLEKLSLFTGAQLLGDKAKLINGVATLDKASENELSFLSHPRYLKDLLNTKAGAVCLPFSLAQDLPPNTNLLLAEDPSLLFQKIAELFLNLDSAPSFEGIHSKAIVHPTAKIDPTAIIGPFVFIDKDVTIGANTIIYPHCFIGQKATIGQNTLLYPSVTIREHCAIGSSVIIQPGAVIGSCGFGYLPQKDGSWKKLKQLGNVIIEDEVEIGANAAIDRARFHATVVKKGAKIDNLVQIAHNVEIGEYTAIASQTGVSGSTKLGRNVILAGQVGVAGHLELENFVQVSAKSGVSKDLKTGKYRGVPAIPMDEYQRQMVHVRKLAKYLKRIEALEEKLQELEKNKTV